MQVPARPVLRALLAGFLLPLAAPAQSITWAPTLDGALAEARTRGTVVVIAIQMPGERGSDEMLERHYADPAIQALSKESVNILLQVGPGTVPADERKVRDRYLKVAPDAPVAVPHHLFVKPGADGEPGELLSSFAYEVTIGQLEWAWADAIRKVRPDFEWKSTERARAPESLLYGDAEKEGVPPPPSKDEVREAIKTLRSGTREPKKVFDSYRIVLSSSEREALQYGKTEMRSMGPFLKRPAMRLVADASPKEWHELAEDFLDDNDTAVRAEAARALERLAEPKSVKVIRKLLPKEDDDEVRGRMLRAMAACGPTDKAVVKELERVLHKDKVAAVRVQAAAATVPLEDRDAVRKLIGIALGDDDPQVRSAAVYAIAARRDADLAQLLDDRAKVESDTEVTGWIATAQEVLKGGDLRKFDPFASKVLGDRKRGDGLRQFSLKIDDWLERMRGRGGAGGGDAGGGDPGKGAPPAGGGRSGRGGGEP